MTVKNNCRKICEELRRRGFDENSETTGIIPEDAVANAAHKMKWAKITRLRYVGKTGFLVEYGYLEVVSDDGILPTSPKSEYRLTGEDLNE